MSSPPKIEYLVDLTAPVAAASADGVTTRSITPADRDDLARLMLDAYIGTIDYEGETFDDAIEEVGSYFADNPLVDCSLVATVEGDMASAVLVARSQEMPVIGYVMTAASHKRRGIARLVVGAALSGLHSAGYAQVTLFITDGNKASEALFAGFGATRR